MKLQNFRKAVQLATQLEFDDFGFHENIKTEAQTLVTGITLSGYYENWAGLFMDEDNGYFSLQLHEDGWKMCYDDEPFCKISEKLSKALDGFRAWEMGKEAREEKETAEWRQERNELMRSYGPGKI